MIERPASCRPRCCVRSEPREAEGTHPWGCPIRSPSCCPRNWPGKSTTWAAGELLRALARRQVRAELLQTASESMVVEIAGNGHPPSLAAPMRCRRWRRSFASTAVVTGSSPGAATARPRYALTELPTASRTRKATCFRRFPAGRAATARVRSIARLFSARGRGQESGSTTASSGTSICDARQQPLQPVRPDSRHGLQLPLPQQHTSATSISTSPTRSC